MKHESDLLNYIQDDKAGYKYKMVDETSGLSHHCTHFDYGVSTEGQIVNAIENSLKSLVNKRVNALLDAKYGAERLDDQKQRLKVLLVVNDAAFTDNMQEHLSEEALKQLARLEIKWAAGFISPKEYGIDNQPLPLVRLVHDASKRAIQFPAEIAYGLVQRKLASVVGCFHVLPDLIVDDFDAQDFLFAV